MQFQYWIQQLKMASPCTYLSKWPKVKSLNNVAFITLNPTIQSHFLTNTLIMLCIVTMHIQFLILQQHIDGK